MDANDAKDLDGNEAPRLQLQFVLQQVAHCQLREAGEPLDEVDRGDGQEEGEAEGGAESPQPPRQAPAGVEAAGGARGGAGGMPQAGATGVHGRPTRFLILCFVHFIFHFVVFLY